MIVVLFDDDPVSRSITTDFLESVGFIVRPCATPTEFILASADDAPDIALIDLELETVSAPEILTALRSWLTSRKMRVILHSELSERELFARIREMDVDGFIRKTGDGGAFYAAFCAAAGVLPMPTVAPPDRMRSGTVSHLPPELRVGIPWIDAQHALLVAAYGQFAEAVRGGQSGETAAFLGFLERYASFHFAAEEALLPIGTPETKRHRMEHQSFLVAIRKLHHESQFPSHAEGTPLRVTEFVGQWVDAHIRGSDRELSA